MVVVVYVHGNNHVSFPFQPVNAKLYSGLSVSIGISFVISLYYRRTTPSQSSTKSNSGVLHTLLYTTHNTCHVMLDVILNTKVSPYHILLLLLTYPCRVC